MRSTRRSRRPIARAAAVVEHIALALWMGALAGFAFLFAPAAFHTIPDLDVFGTLVARVFGLLTLTGYGCGAVAIAMALIRSAGEADRRLEALRILLVASAMGLVAYQDRAVTPAMNEAMQRMGGHIGAVAPSDPRRQEYRALHTRSSQVYAVVLLFGLTAIALAAAKPVES